ncbi:MAG TPA: sulfite exporter TauE/SafE family protein [Candidatus Marinimicrobia bacterium]|nr:sulfite exporter TauE/SafE family protein [Candidatus Neomarinimicrobiota bacterium]HRS51679.1 sulfite exporter TauE/SafE family protein [Candidatus Neomarinimicrobiota bacterium]HRU92171.1 sulfite exporter TauE/SafE family protein [Candidatus Neomarinimicrobiota bacterium]
MLTNLFFILVGLMAGILSGLFGIGGGIVIVPILIWFGHFSQLAANSTSLAALLLPVGILAVLTYHKEKMVNVRQALLISLGIFIGVVGGAISALEIPAPILKRLYGIFLLYIAWTYIDIRSLFLNRYKREESNPRYEIVRFNQPSYYIILGFVAGMMSGLFGIGGGIIIVPALISIFKYPYKKAVGTSLMALLLPVGLPGVLVYYRAGQLQIAPALSIALGLLFGALIGALISIKLPSRLIKRIYGIFLLLAGFNFIFQNPG